MPSPQSFPDMLRGLADHLEWMKITAADVRAVNFTTQPVEISVALPVILRLEQDDAPPAQREEMPWHLDDVFWMRRVKLVRNGVLLAHVEFIDPPTGGGQ